jgi:alkaline phosphatase D
VIQQKDYSYLVVRSMKQPFQKLNGSSLGLDEVELNTSLSPRGDILDSDSTRQPLSVDNSGADVSGEKTNDEKQGWFPPNYITRALIIFVPCFLLISLVVILVSIHFIKKTANTRFLPLPPSTTILNKVTFGSCAMQYLPQPFWDTLHDPIGVGDFFIFGGDNVYGDAQKQHEWVEACPDKKCLNLLSAYNKLGSKPSFVGFRKQHPILPIWDDHDFGYNDGGATFKYKEISLDIFKKFFDVKKNDQRYNRKGLYGNWVYGDANKNRMVHLIMLDLRYYKSDWVLRDPKKEYPTNGRYINSTDPSKTMLGDVQWKWLESQLLKVNANVCVVVSSLQVLSVATAWEAWSRFPLQRFRLLKLLDESKCKNVVFLTGDRHVGGIYKYGKYYEITSSSLTHTVTHSIEKDSLRLYPLVHVNNVASLVFAWESNQVVLNLHSVEGRKAGEVLQTYNFTMLSD